MLFAFYNDKDTVDKINCLARYIIATNGAPFPEICEWLKNHDSPYPKMSEKIYHELFKKLGTEKKENINIFQQARARTHSDSDNYYSFDTSTVSTYGENNSFACYGFNKDDDHLKVIKIKLLFEVIRRLPIAYAKQHGNIPDVSSLCNAAKKINKIIDNLKLLIIDNGFYLESNICYLLKKYTFFNFN